jgi:hypothetical protein
MRCMRYLISRQWSVLQDFDITGESGDLRYQVRGNLGFTQSLTITEPARQRTAQITRTPFTTRHQVIIDGQRSSRSLPSSTMRNGWIALRRKCLRSSLAASWRRSSRSCSRHESRVTRLPVCESSTSSPWGIAGTRSRYSNCREG